MWSITSFSEFAVWQSIFCEWFTQRMLTLPNEGLCFSVPQGVAIPPSLRNVSKTHLLLNRKLSYLTA